jgi:hypothetical protein
VGIGFFGIFQKVWNLFQVRGIHNNKRKNTVVVANCKKVKIDWTSIMIFFLFLSTNTNPIRFQKIRDSRKKSEDFIGSIRNLTPFVKMNK